MSTKPSTQTTKKKVTSEVGKRPSELGRKFGRRKGAGRPPLTEVPTPKELRDIERKRAFITGMAKHGTALKACEHAGITYTAYYMWTNPQYAVKQGYEPDRWYDPEFVEAVAQAQALHNQKVIDCGMQRAIDGWVNTSYDSQGNVLREEFRYDSAILQMLMKRADPQLKEKSPEINVDARHQTVNMVSAEALDSLSPQQKKLLLQAARLEQPSAPDEGVIDGVTEPQGGGS